MREKIEEMFREEGMDFSGAILFVPSLDYKDGKFFPRRGYGLVEASGDSFEDWLTYIHEYAHGAFFENKKLGKQVKRLEEEKYRWEKELFDRCDNAQLFVGNTNMELNEKLASKHPNYDPEKDRYFMVSRESIKGYLKKKELLKESRKEFEGEIEEFADKWVEKVIQAV